MSLVGFKIISQKSKNSNVEFFAKIAKTVGFLPFSVFSCKFDFLVFGELVLKPTSVGTVTETIKMKLKTPWISPSYQEVFSGESVTFSCLSNAAITWSGPDGKPIQSSERFRISKEGDLEIKKTFKTDSGRYKCDSDEGTHRHVPI